MESIVSSPNIHADVPYRDAGYQEQSGEQAVVCCYNRYKADDTDNRGYQLIGRVHYGDGAVAGFVVGIFHFGIEFRIVKAGHIDFTGFFHNFNLNIPGQHVSHQTA